MNPGMIFVQRLRGNTRPWRRCMIWSQYFVRSNTTLEEFGAPALLFEP